MPPGSHELTTFPAADYPALVYLRLCRQYTDVLNFSEITRSAVAYIGDIN
jgi:hypothetical protein